MTVFNICVSRLSKTSIVNSFRNRFRLVDIFTSKGALESLVAFVDVNPHLVSPCYLNMFVICCKNTSFFLIRQIIQPLFLDEHDMFFMFDVFKSHT